MRRLTTRVGVRVARTFACGHDRMLTESKLSRACPRPAMDRHPNCMVLVAGVKLGRDGAFEELRELITQTAYSYRAGASEPTNNAHDSLQNDARQSGDLQARNLHPQELKTRIDETMMIVVEAILGEALQTPAFLPAFIQILVRRLV